MITPKQKIVNRKHVPLHARVSRKEKQRKPLGCGGMVVIVILMFVAAYLLTIWLRETDSFTLLLGFFQ